LEALFMLYQMTFVIIAMALVGGLVRTPAWHRLRADCRLGLSQRGEALQ
jgi:hypothetical protein